MARPRTPVGAHGAINLKQIEAGKWRARTLFRFEDGNRRQVERFAGSRAKAENALKQALTVISTPAASGSITRTTTIAALGDAYLAHKRSLNRAPRTLQTYEYNIAQHVNTGIGHLTIGEASTKRVQTFIDAGAREHGSGSAKGCRSVLSGMFALAIRNDAIRINPVSGVAGIEKTRSRTSTALPPMSYPRSSNASGTMSHSNDSILRSLSSS